MLGNKYEDTYKISIHALREEGDNCSRPSRKAPKDFYPRPPRGGRRLLWEHWKEFMGISIHALREEGDSSRAVWMKPKSFLSTPSARRATWQTSVNKPFSTKFLSTPSARRATSHQFLCDFWYNISIHALREEGDVGKVEGDFLFV